MTAILGGGISGLSAAYYGLQNKKIGSIVLYEASDRLGGWIKSVQSNNGIIFEKGPRTIRPRGIAGENTLELVNELNLNEKVIPISINHPAARNRLIYVNKKLHLLPNSLTSFLQIQKPFDRRLISILWNDLTSPKAQTEDDSIYNFTKRRFGKDVADYLISPMICGICAGNAKEISVNFLMKSLFEYEQKYGSVTKGFLISTFKELLKKKEEKKITENKREFKNRAKEEKWAVWGLQGGLEQLPIALKNNLSSNSKIKLLTKKKCEQIMFKNNQVELIVDGQVEKYERIISSLSATNLAPLLKNQHPKLSQELDSIPSTTVAVVNLHYANNILPMEAFGFLIPPQENLPILGVIFDSCIFKNKSGSVLTVMMGGAWFNKYFNDNLSKDHFLTVAANEVKKILEIKQDPIEHDVAILKDCIPQHVIGHSQKLKRIENYIQEHNIPLQLCGSSYQGVGLNDVILSAKQAVFQMT